MIRRALASSVLLVAFAAGCADPTPETPSNAVMEFLTDEQVGNPDASDRLCDSLIAQLDAGEGPDLEGFHRIVDDAGNVFGAGVSSEHEDTAVVMLDVQFVPSREFDNLEAWEAHLAREDGRWKVCGFSARGAGDAASS